MSLLQEASLSWIQKICLKVLQCGRIPNHLALIADGSRRYGEKYQMHRLKAYFLGCFKMAETLLWCSELGIPEVTMYIFSIENFGRPAEDVEMLMEVTKQNFNDMEMINKLGVKVQVIGNITLLPTFIQQILADIINKTKDNSNLIFNMAFSYTGHDDMTNAVKEIVSGVSDNMLFVDDINEALIDNCLYTNECTEPDLFIRTSGVRRLGDFLLWQMSRSCIYFSQVLWPEFTLWQLFSAVFYYQHHYNDLSVLRKCCNHVSTLPNLPRRVLTFLNSVKYARYSALEQARKDFSPDNDDKAPAYAWKF